MKEGREDPKDRSGRLAGMVFTWAILLFLLYLLGLFLYVITMKALFDA